MNSVTCFFFSSRHDYEEERKARLKKIESLEEEVVSLQAQEATTDHQLDQFRNAIQKYKNDRFKLGYVVEVVFQIDCKILKL